jgi:hypothetical protein
MLDEESAVLSTYLILESEGAEYSKTSKILFVDISCMKNFCLGMFSMQNNLTGSYYFFNIFCNDFF